MAHTIKAAPPPAPPLEMTYEAFLQWADEDTHAEWVDGKVLFMSPVSNRHADLSGFLESLMRFFVEVHQRGVIRSDPFQMKIATRPSGRQPDILFVATENLPRLKDNYLDGPGDLVVEVISPDDAARDRVDKFKEYQEGGVREYWLLDPTQRQADFLLLGEDGQYHPISIGEDGVFRSVVLAGLWIKVDWLWQEPLPPLLDVLKEWGLI